MKKRGRKLVRNVEVKIHDLPPGAMEPVEALVNSARAGKKDSKELEHVER